MIGLAFAFPLLLWGLLALPVLWFLLRAVPPAPIRRRFPGVALLLGLRDQDRQAEKTPWWLMALRMAAIALVIVGFAGPVLNPKPVVISDKPLLILFDGGWAEAPDWSARLDHATALLEEAGRSGRLVAVVQLADLPQAVSFGTATDWKGRLAALVPRPWLAENQQRWIADLPKGDFDSAWLTDNLSHSGRPLLAADLQKRGALTVYASARPILALHPAVFADGKVKLTVSRLPASDGATLDVTARGPDPSGIEQDLGRGTLSFAAAADKAELALDLPPELRNRVTRFEIVGQSTAGAVSLADDSLKRRKVAIVAEGSDREGLQILSPTHYLRQALQPTADVLEGGVGEILPANPDVIILVDVARLPQTETDGLLGWVKKGGLLLRFAGPKLAASDLGRSAEDPLMPVRLREGGRTVGGAMSWDDPKALAPFPEGSPFHGLQVPADVTVTSQVLAQPDPDLASRTIAALADGTPLVTRKALGQGQVVLFHVTANAEWSSLPLSGLFVQLLERLAVTAGSGDAVQGELTGLTWVPERLLDGYGRLGDAAGLAGVPGAALALAAKSGPGAAVPPGIYRADDRLVAVNAVGPATVLAPAGWPLGTRIVGLAPAAEQSLKGWALALALLLLSVDILAALLVSGRLVRVAAVLVLGWAVLHGPQAQAQTADEAAIAATEGVILAYVKTGDTQVDQVSAAGLTGLGDQLWNRTAVEPLAPIGVDVEKDELAFFPFLYWPVTADAAVPSAAAYTKLNRFLRTGGLILFDTRDGDVAGAGGTSAEAQSLQRIAQGLDIPPLEPLPEDHVLTRTFYLLQEFPGRFAGGGLWVEAAPPDAALAAGMPFRNLNDGVTPVVIGGNDWASAWAVDENGMAMFPVGRGYAGEKQREYAYRFGVNLIMYVLTGNYKSDQVHVPALLERLGK